MSGAGDDIAEDIVADEEVIRIPITGELDLHTFAPAETSRVLTAYFEACREKGIFRVRVVHGKGTGALRETVHAFLRHSTLVKGFQLGDETSGGWGATIVTLRSSGPHPEPGRTEVAQAPAMTRRIRRWLF